MAEEIPQFDLPDWASQVGATIYVGTAVQAIEVLDYVPTQWDNIMGVVITDERERNNLSFALRYLEGQID